MIAYLMQEEEVGAGQEAENHSKPGEAEDDLLAEGYLPEIYFQLKSDSTTDW